MSSHPSQKTANGAPGGSGLGDVARGLVSIALCLYLLGFSLSVACNSGSGSSLLASTVKSKLFSPWMVPLWLDIGFDERLTYGQVDDADHVIEVQPWAGGDAVRFPQAGASGMAAARWRTLAGWLEPEMVPEEIAGLLPTAIAESLFDELGSDDLRVRVLRVAMPERSGFVASEEPAFEQAFAARVRRVAGSVQLLPVEEQRDVAPVVTPAQPAADQGETR